jgi:hypothetical protein
MPQFPRQWQSRPGAGSVGGDEAGAAPAGAAMEWVLNFDPERAGRAIVFHMIDEGLAREVEAESVKRTVARLRRRGLRPAIRRSAWELMTNHERLEWLLSETLTVPLMRPDDDVVSLETRDDR